MAEDEFPPESDASGRLLIKRCPDCAELVQAEAHSCPYCRFDFATGIGAGEVERADPGEPGIEPAEPELPKQESQGDSDGLTEDEVATFAIFAAAAKNSTDSELADLLMGFPSETSIQHRAIVAEQARRRDVPLPELLTVPDVGQPQPVAAPVPVAVPLPAAVAVPVPVPLPAGVQLSSAGRRPGAFALDVLLFVVTLAIGWLVW